MQYPKLKIMKASRKMLDVFEGYHHALRIGDGEFYEMENLTSDHYPLLSPRGKRGVFATPGIPQGMIARDRLCYIDGGDFIIGETRVPMGLTADEKPKTLVSMGAYVIIMPDKKYICTADISDRGEIGAAVTTTDKTVFSLCDVQGTVYENLTIQPIVPEDPANYSHWVDTSQNPSVLRQYLLAHSAWVDIVPTYIRMESAGIGVPFSVGDGVRISGALGNYVGHLNDISIIEAKGDDFIVIRGMIDGMVTQEEPITVERAVPDLDFLIESENRLWGCKNGVGKNGENLNKIYACKRGDFRNWECFSGDADDSVEMTVGSDGAFTGAVTHLGYPLFFKENCLHKIYGTNARNYQVQTTALRGIQEGCSRSAAVVNEVLYYKSRTGVCSYDGSLPTEISSALGDTAYGRAAAGAFGNKYYISMSEPSGAYHLFVYDTRKKMWHREDSTQTALFCACGDDLYYVDGVTNRIMTVGGSGMKEAEPVRWSAVSGIFGTDSPDKKYISRMDVRMKLDVGTRVSFYIEYDSSGEYEYLFTMTGKRLQSFSVPFRTKRCDHLRLRIVGVGEAKIFSVCRTVEGGSDL